MKALTVWQPWAQLIADELSISVGTVCNYLKKLEAGNE